MATHYQDLPTKSKHFDTLYHGTLIKNAAIICKEGIKRGEYERVGEISRNDEIIGPDERIADCIGTVNMSRNRKGAIFFACAYDMMNNEGQAIFEIDPSKLDTNHMFFRDMFNKKYAEVKYIGDVPPEAIKRVFLRKFTWKPKLKVEEVYRTCDEILEGKL